VLVRRPLLRQPAGLPLERLCVALLTAMLPEAAADDVATTGADSGEGRP
jgi:hypothetical protein